MLTLTVPADSRYVTMVRALACTFLENLAVDPDDIYDVSLILGEACSNVVRHAYESQRETYTVELEMVPEGLAITVSDHGRGLNPDELRPPDPNRANGWGMWLVQHIADHVAVTSVAPTGTRVRAQVTLRYRDGASAREAALLIHGAEPCRRSRRSRGASSGAGRERGGAGSGPLSPPRGRVQRCDREGADG